MKKKIILSVMLLVMVIVACVALVACKEDAKIYITLNYSITSQYTDLDFCIKDSLLIRPDNPRYENGIFYPCRLSVSNSVFNKDNPCMENPRLNTGYDSNCDYIFVAWYKDPEFCNIWNFDIDIATEDMTLYAKWQPINFQY